MVRHGEPEGVAVIRLAWEDGLGRRGIHIPIYPPPAIDFILHIHPPDAAVGIAAAPGDGQVVAVSFSVWSAVVGGGRLGVFTWSWAVRVKLPTAWLVDALRNRTLNDAQTDTLHALRTGLLALAERETVAKDV